MKNEKQNLHAKGKSSRYWRIKLMFG